MCVHTKHCAYTERGLLCMTRSLFVVPVLNKLPSVEIFTKPVIILLGNLYETLKEDRYASGLNDPQSVDECWLLLDDLVS